MKDGRSGELTALQYQEHVPGSGLDRFIRLIWIMEVDGPVVTGPPERIVPDGIVEVVFHYRRPFEMRFAGGGFERLPGSFALTQTRRYVEIRPTASSGFISIRFEPWGACHFFHLPLSEISDQLVDAADLWGPEARQLEEELVEARSAQERIGLVESFLLRQLQRNHRRAVEPLVQAVWQGRGQMRISELARDLGLGERRLRRIFDASIGTSPKRFSRITRFLHACKMLRSPEQIETAFVAHDCGYSDQAHLSGEVVSLSGLTPGELRRSPHLSYLEIG